LVPWYPSESGLIHKHIVKNDGLGIIVGIIVAVIAMIMIVIIIVIEFDEDRHNSAINIDQKQKTLVQGLRIMRHLTCDGLISRPGPPARHPRAQHS
jgi:hypothetical protein